MVIGRFEIRSYTQVHHERGKSNWEVNLNLWPAGGRVSLPVDKKFVEKHPIGSQITLSARGLKTDVRDRSEDL